MWVENIFFNLLEWKIIFIQQYSVILLHCDHWRHFESFLLKAFFLPSFLIYLNWLPACVRGSVEIKKSFMLTLEQVSQWSSSEREAWAGPPFPCCGLWSSLFPHYWDISGYFIVALNKRRSHAPLGHPLPSSFGITPPLLSERRPWALRTKLVSYL